MEMKAKYTWLMINYKGRMSRWNNPKFWTSALYELSQHSSFRYIQKCFIQKYFCSINKKAHNNIIILRTGLEPVTYGLQP